MQLADKVGPDQPARMGLCCLLTESIDSVVYVNKQRITRIDGMDAHADLRLPCLQSA